MNNFIRIFIVEDQPTWQNMITRELNLYPEFLVVGIAESVALCPRIIGASARAARSGGC